MKGCLPSAMPSRTVTRPWGWGFAAQLAALVAGWLLVGCVAVNSNSNGGIGDLHLFAVPNALNLDGNPGPDGIGVRIYASPPGKAEGVAVRSGRIEIWIWDGVVTNPGSHQKTLHVWSFGSADLEPFAGSTTTLGVGYQLALGWGTNRPSGKVVTVQARYHAPNGQALSSTTSTISVGLR